MQNKEFVILVDKNDNQIGEEEKLAAHKKSLLHRAFSVFILRERHGKVEILLHQRNKEKYHSGGLWTNACCGHPCPTEKTMHAAKRRLFEEMGMDVPLNEIGIFHYKEKLDNELTENEIDHVFIGKSDLEQIPFNPDEVAQTRWVSVDDLQEEMAKKPQSFTVWFSPALDIVLKSKSPPVRILKHT